MAFGFTTYVDPGVYQQEVLVPSGINIPAQPFAVCLVGVGSRNKRVTNEAVLRGVVKDESLTVAGSSPHSATLANRADKKLENTTVYRTLNGVTSVVLDSYISFNAASILGTVSGTVDLSVNNAFALEMDGKDAITLVLLSGAPSVAISGRQVTVTGTLSGAGGNAATIAEIVTLINAGLAGAGALGYGAAYNAVASTSGGALLITSPVSTPNSDVRVFAPIADSALVTIFGAPAGDLSNRDALSILVISDLIWNASATWTADYVRLVDDADPLAQTTNVQSIVAVGASPGTTSFYEAEDWLLNTNEVDWNQDTAATLTGLAETYDVSTNDQLVLRLDGKLSSIGLTTDVIVDLNGLASPPIGYANPGDPALATAAEIAANINAVLAQHLGPRYAAVASVDGSNRIVLTSPIEGRASSSIEVAAASANSAHTALFGGTFTRLGTGKRPAIGSVYFVTYEYTRPTGEYNVPIRHFSAEAALAQVGQVSPTVAGYNPLAIASQLAFENGSEYIYTIQVNDLLEGNPSRAQVKDALDGAGTIAGTTEVLVVGEPGTRLDISVDKVDHLEAQNGPIERHYRRGFFGMAAGTAIGDRATENTIVHRATRTLQVAATSPARGRMFMVAPPQVAGVSRTLVFEDGTEARVTLDSTFLSVAVAARRTSLPSPAETLTRRTITGFNTDDITAPWKPAERRFMASQGVLVVTYDAGRFVMLDAMSTEGGGGGKESFKVDSTSYQKDIVVTKINQALDANAVGIVPFDLASFILDIKLIIQGVLANEISKGTIGPFRDRETGALRSIDLRTDIRVEQNVNVPTEFNFSYWFNLRYPALRLLGQYSVDNPFFALAA